MKIPASIPATLTAEITLKGFAKRDYKIKSEFSELPGAKRVKKTISTKGKINGGGDKIELSTVNGDIKIEKN